MNKENISIHGVLLSIDNIGIVIRGKSGIGKSECAAELINKGAKLVADDLIIISNINGDVSIENGLVVPKREGQTFTYSGISMLSPELFHTSELDKFELWEEILLPASKEGLVSGEIYCGLLNNLNSLEEAEKLDALLTGE